MFSRPAMFLRLLQHYRAHSQIWCENIKIKSPFAYLKADIASFDRILQFLLDRMYFETVAIDHSEDIKFLKQQNAVR